MARLWVVLGLLLVASTAAHAQGKCDAPPYGNTQAKYEAFVKNFGPIVGDADKFLKNICEKAEPAPVAQINPMVQCQIGSWSRLTPDFVCRALVKGASKLTTDASTRDACVAETSKFIRFPNGDTGQLHGVCEEIRIAETLDGTIALPAGFPAFPPSASESATPDAAYCSTNVGGRFVWFWATKADCRGWVERVDAWSRNR